MSSLEEKWHSESVESLKKAEEMFSNSSTNKVFATVDSVGSIEAYIFGEDGIVSAVPCYDDVFGGKFALRLSYPEVEKIKAVYAQKQNLDVNEILTNDEDFIKFALELFKLENNGWEITHASWTHTYSRLYGHLYDSKQDAINALWSNDVFDYKKEHTQKNSL